MVRDIWTLLTERTVFFAGLLLEHLEISLLAIVIAILAGGLAGILISEFQRAQSRHWRSLISSIRSLLFLCLDS